MVTMAVWTPEDTETWLSDNPLPADFLWPYREPKPDGTPDLRVVLPTYRLTKGYGFWLRTTPYFPGLFEDCHAVLVGMGEELPVSGEDLALRVQAAVKARGIQQNLF